MYLLPEQMIESYHM